MANILTFSVHNTASLEVVWRNFNDNTIARHNPDEVLPHFAGHVCHHLMAVFELNAKLCVRERLDDVAFDLNCFFLRHSEFFFRPFPKSAAGPEAAFA